MQGKRTTIYFPSDEDKEIYRELLSILKEEGVSFNMWVLSLIRAKVSTSGGVPQFAEAPK